MSTALFFIALMATPLWALPSLPPVSISTPSIPSVSGVPSVSPKIPVPNTNGVCDCPVIPNLEVLVCVLDWISHVKILDKEVKTVNGTTFNQYTLQHIEIIKGVVGLPSVLLVPMGPCGLELEVDLEYLLSGLVTGETNLYSVLCLQVLNVLSPVWSSVDDSLLNQLGLLDTLGDLVCGLLGPVLATVLGLVKGLPGLDILNGIVPSLPIVGDLTGAL